jgi:DNA-binding MarR family transcriptional regulator
MDDLRTRLENAYAELHKLKCSRTQLFDDSCQIKDLTYTQIEYLKTIDQEDYMTVSDLAEKTMNSKPTVTEMIKKFIALDCVRKEPCQADGRKVYLKLTQRGKKIARMEEYVIGDVIDHIQKQLTKDEIETLIQLLIKGTST